MSHHRLRVEAPVAPAASGTKQLRLAPELLHARDMSRMPLLVVTLAVLSLSLEGCLWGNCAAVCSDPFTISFVDERGNAINDVSGTLTQTGGAAESFRCGSTATASDAGAVSPCAGNTVTAYSYSDHRSVVVSVIAADGKRFDGSVTPTYAASGSHTCGSTCFAGTATVILK